MREGSPGSSSIAGDSIMYKDLTSWRILFSPSTGNYYWDITDYHPGELEINPSDLEKMIEFAKKHKK